MLLDRLLPRAWNWGFAAKEDNFQSSHPTQIYQALLQVKFESGGDEEQVYGDWDQCSRKLWYSRDRAWQLQCAPLLLPSRPQLSPSVWVTLQALTVGPKHLLDCETVIKEATFYFHFIKVRYAHKSRAMTCVLLIEHYDLCRKSLNWERKIDFD